MISLLLSASRVRRQIPLRLCGRQQSKGAKVIAMTNVKGSTISREADFRMHTQAGMEIAVATSKGYLTQVLCLYMIAAERGRMRGILNETAVWGRIRGKSQKIAGTVGRSAEE